MFVGDNDGLGAFIVDSSGRIVARARGVRMLAPGYSLRHGVSSKSYVPPSATARYQKFMTQHPGVTGWEAYGSHATYTPGVGQLPMNVLAQRAMASSSGRLSGDGMFGWKYGPHAAYTPMGQLPMNVLARKAMASSSGTIGDGGMFGWKYGSHAAYTPGVGQLPMNVVAQDALRSSSGQVSGFDGDESMADMFGPEGEASALF